MPNPVKKQAVKWIDDLVGAWDDVPEGYVRLENGDLFKLSNSGDTQVATTVGTYRKAAEMLDRLGSGDKRIDYGAGKGLGTDIIKAKSYEPFPEEGFTPDYTTPPNELFDAVVNLNVLNVLPPQIRDQVAKELLDRVRMGGDALVGARSYSDVMNAKNPKMVGDGGIVTSKGTYQYGFGGKNEGLIDYMNRMAEDMGEGKRFTMEKAPLAATGAKIKRVPKKKKSGK